MNTHNRWRMNGIFLILFLFVIAFIMFLNYKLTSTASLQQINSAQLIEMSASTEDMVIVDLREPELFSEGRVNSSINLPYAEIRQRYKELPRDKKIVFVCHTGRMGVESGNLLIDNEYKQVYNLEGGIASWDGELVRNQ